MAESRRGPDWVLVNPQAPWQARDSQGEFAFDNHLWLLGGWVAAKEPNLRDVWKSPNGRDWTCVTAAAPWEYSDLSVALTYDDRLWLMGGRKLPGKANSNEVWSSPDGAAWTLETPQAGWCPRVGASFAVFHDRMWVLAGTDDFYINDDTTNHNDVWSSTDGRDWRLDCAAAPWARRTNAQAVVFQDKLWLAGGGSWAPETVLHNDVWCSADGVSWEQVTAAAPWEPRQWFSLVVYRDCLWVLGGWSREHGNYGDVWYSRDGAEWTALTADTIWQPRHEHSVVVSEDKLWLYGGYAEALSSEVWTLGGSLQL